MDREREYWRMSATERPGAFSVELLLHKMKQARVFLEAVERNRTYLERAHVMLELGAGQGWAACAVKAMLSQKTVIASDVAAAAIESVPIWESVFRTKLDGAFACPSFEIPLEDASLDLVFAFDAAHHFGAHRRTLAEVHRVLRPEGVCLYLHEPTVPRFLYKPAVGRMNRKRAGYGHDVVEDVLVGDHLLSIASDLGFGAHRTYAPSLAARRGKEWGYYLVVSRLGPIQRWLPSAADFVFAKRPAGPPLADTAIEL